MAKYTMRWCNKNDTYSESGYIADSYQEAYDYLPQIIENMIRQGDSEEGIIDGCMIIEDSEFNIVFTEPCSEPRYNL